jgi:hypothetical protein
VMGPALILSSCAASTRLVGNVPPAALLDPCTPPVPLPAGALDRAAVLKLWGQDRLSLAECLARQQALVEHNLGY